MEERQQVERSIQSSALSHYHAFIDSANCLSVVQQQLSNACDGLEKLSTSVPEMATTFDSFSKDATGVMAQHTANKQLLGKCSQQCTGAGSETHQQTDKAEGMLDSCVCSGCQPTATNTVVHVGSCSLSSVKPLLLVPRNCAS